MSFLRNPWVHRVLGLALGGTLGAVQFAAVFAAATAFLAVQRLLGIDSPRAASPAAESGLADSALLATDEQSALVEIEAMKILRKDRREFEELALSEGCPGIESRSSRAAAFDFPWTAKLAFSTLAVLMIGTSF